MASAAETVRGERNHPLALRMGVIAFITQNLAVGALYGAYGVLIIPLEEKLGVGRTVSTLGVPLAGIGIALLAPLVGGLTTRMSLKLVMMIGSLMAAAGFALLAVTASPPIFLLAYAVLIGPGICLSGVMPPAILTVRWFILGAGTCDGDRPGAADDGAAAADRQSGARDTRPRRGLPDAGRLDGRELRDRIPDRRLSAPFGRPWRSGCR
jgi:hypothetical protein